MRLNKLIASRLGISRRAADKLIKDGRVKYDDKIADVTETISDFTVVKIDGNYLPKEKALCTIILNKPVGYVCSRNGQGGKVIYDLLPKDLHYLNPVGRLDKDSSGLLILTNDGALNNKLSHPSFEKTKIYEVELNKKILISDLIKINKGLMLKDGISNMNAQQKNKYLQVSMHEGKNRQIRRTFESLGYRVVRLHRTNYGPLGIDNLKFGSFKEITL
jgi:pseudouridine synthase